MNISKQRINRHFRQIRIIAVIAFLMIVAISIYGNSHGYINVTAKTSGGCGGTGGSCHGYVSTEVSLDIASGSGSWTVEPNSITTFTIHIYGKPFLPKSGINIAVKDVLNGTVDIGTLIPGPNLQVSFKELTHVDPFDMVMGLTTLTFSWKAPVVDGTYYIQAVGVAANNNGSNTGDFFNWMIPQPITVLTPEKLTIVSPVGGEEWGAGTVHDITWTSQGFVSMKIELSSDGGLTFPTVLTPGALASMGKWSWNISPTTQTGNKYRIRLSNATNFQTRSSSPNNFTIDGPPIILTQPESKTVCQGDPVTFYVEATGIGMSYAWYKSNVAIPNATSASFTIAKTIPLDDGNFYCIVTGAFGDPTTSNSALLDVTPIPVITTDPANNTASEGSAVTISVQATGPDLHYIWMKDGVVVPSQTNADFVIAKSKVTDNGDYNCIVWNSCGRDTSAKAKITVASNGPALTLKQALIDFDTVFVSKSKEILAQGIIQNTGSKTLNVTKMTVFGLNSLEYTITEGDAPFTVNSLDSHSIRFKFIPLEKGQRTASIEFENDASSKTALNLTGFAAQIELQAQETSIYYDTVMFNAPKIKSAMVQNLGNVDAKVTNLDFTGTNADRFQVIDPLPPFIIHADSTKEIKIQLTTKKKGLNEAVLVIAADNLDSAYFIYLSGIGENPLSVEEDYISSAIKIYPNPSNDALHFVLPQELVNDINIQIIDNLGNVVKKFAINPFNTIEWNGIDDSGNMVPSGVYQAIINYSENIITREIVIIR